MMNTLNQRKEKAHKLAKEMIRIESGIKTVLESGQSNFDVFYDEEYDCWVVQTSYCQMGGCLYDFIQANSEKEARRIAAIKTYFGEKSSTGGVCNDCQQDMYDMMI